MSGLDPVPSVRPPGALASIMSQVQVPSTVVWIVAFVSVSVLVGLGKMDSKVLEYLIMAIGGATAAGRVQSNGTGK